MKVYLLILEYFYEEDRGFEIEVFGTREKAIERLKQKADEEKRESYIADYDKKDFTGWEEKEDYFYAELFYGKTTCIYILEREVG